MFWKKEKVVWREARARRPHRRMISIAGGNGQVLIRLLSCGDWNQLSASLILSDDTLFNLNTFSSYSEIGF